MQVTLVRHGATDWNAAGRYQGRSDIGLNADGLVQARQAARSLRHATFDAVVASDLLRCRQTVEILCEGKPWPSVAYDPRWREIDFGLREGLTWPEIEARGLADDRSAGVEDVDAAAQRVCEALYELLDGGYDNALIVTHSGPMYFVIAKCVPNHAEELAKTRPPGSIFTTAITVATKRRRTRPRPVR